MCDLARSEVLQNSMRDSGSCDAGNNLYQQVTVSSLFSKVAPMLRARAEGSWFTESWHAFESGRNQLCNLDKKMCDTGVCAATSGWVQAF